MTAAVFQLKEAEDQTDGLETRLRKLTREKKFLKDELDEAVAAGGAGSGDSKMLFSELQTLQKEYRELSDRFKSAAQAAASQPGNEASSDRPSTRHSSRK